MRNSHIGAVEIFAQIHEREESAEDAGFQSSVSGRPLVATRAEALAMFGDVLDDFSLPVVRSVAQRGLAAHARRTVFYRQCEMQHALVILARAGGTSALHPLISQYSLMVCPGGR